MAAVGYFRVMASKTSSSRRLLFVAVGAFVLLAGAIDLWRRRAPAGESAPVRLTNDAGLTTEPALSADGKLVAYASDRGGPVLDIWVQPARGGEPHRITTGDADNHSPAFSPDGSRLAFRSERGAGGVYTVPVRGGESVLVAENGRDPQFSPDGKQLAWWVPLPANHGEIHVGRASGGESRRLCPEFRSARYPLWSPDGSHLLFFGDDGRRSDWYVVPAAGGQPARTGARAILGIQGFWTDIVPTAWTRDSVLFTGRSQKSVNIWRMPISPELMQCTAGAKQITSGGTREVHASAAADGTVAWAGTSVSKGVWMLPLDATTGVASGEPVKLADGDDEGVLEPSVSADGGRIAFRRKGAFWVKDVVDGRETELKIPVHRHWPAVISPDGKRAAYHDDNRIFSVPVEGGEPQLICERCWAMGGWSADGTRVLFNHRDAISQAYTASGEKREILRYPKAAVQDARFSPDGRWIAVEMRRRAGRQIWVAPYREGPSPKESEWTAITEETVHSRNPSWSADGTVLYYLSEHEGFRCIWGRRLDRSTRRPVGEPFVVRHFHQSRQALTDPRNPGEMSLAAARGRLVFSMYQTTGNIWLMRRR